jgi:hypothetical protein
VRFSQNFGPPNRRKSTKPHRQECPRYQIPGRIDFLRSLLGARNTYFYEVTIFRGFIVSIIQRDIVQGLADRRQQISDSPAEEIKMFQKGKDED